MAVDKQIIREYGAYANLVAGADPIELQLYMIGIANDTDEMIFRSDDGFHRVLDSGTTALSEHSIPFINSSGEVAQDNANLNFNNGTNILTANILTTLGVINAGGIINAASNIVVANGGSITLYEDITFLGATTENQIKMPDNLADALSFLEGANLYLTFDTTSEYMLFSKPATFIENMRLLGTSSPSLTIECSDATDPLLIFKTTNSPHEIQISLDENVTPDDLQIFGQTAAVDLWISVQAVAGQDAVLYLKTAGAGSAKIIHEADDSLHFLNDTQDADIVFEINDGGVGKTITWDADVDKLKHSAGTFDFDNDILLTEGNITGAVINAVGGFEDNGSAGIDDTFNNADGDVVTISGGIITAITTP